MIDRCRGFSLLEVLVAFAILALALGVLLQIFANSLRAVSSSEEYTHATLLAESKLATVGREIPLEEGETEGEFDDKYRWRVNIQPYQWEEDGEIVENLAADIFQVNVEVYWGEQPRQRSVPLTTLRLAKKQ